MPIPAVYPYVQLIPSIGAAGWMPMLPVTLDHNGTALAAAALVDSGASLNIIPYQLGVQLGGNWNQYPGSLPLGGVFANYPAKPLFLDVRIGTFPPVQLSFGWTQAPTARLLLGQMNFFLEFDVCFYRTRGEFHVQPRTP